jgi:O-antigen/teichoic acid export membrane protein
MLKAARMRWQEFLRARRRSNDFSVVLLDLLGDSAQYFAGLVLLGLANTVLLPLYMHYLDPAQFGLYALIEVTSLALISIAGLGFNTSYLKWYAEVEGPDAFGLLGSMLVISGLSAIAMGALLAASVGSDAAGRLLGGSAKEFAWLLMPLVFFEALYASFESHLRARRRPASISIAALIRLVAIAILSIWLMVFHRGGLTGLFQGRVIGDLLGLSAIIFCCRRDFSLRLSRRLSLGMLRYGTPLVAISLLALGLDAVGRYLLKAYGTLDQVGLYTAGIKISNLMRILFVAPLGAAWGGLMFQIAKKSNAQFIYSKLFGYVFLISSTVALTIAFMTPALFAVLSAPSYRPAMPLVPWLLLVQVVSILQCPISTGMYVGNATRWLIPIYGAGLGVDLVLGRAMVTRYGIYGTAWAWLIGWIVICVLMIIVGQKHYPLQFEWEPLVLSIGICSIVPMVDRLGLFNLEPRSLLLQAVCCAGAVAVVSAYVVRDVRKSHAVFDTSFPSNERLAGLSAESD